MRKANFLMLDESPFGIAPLMVKIILEKIVEINRRRAITLLLVETPIWRWTFPTTAT